HRTTSPDGRGDDADASRDPNDVAPRREPQRTRLGTGPASDGARLPNCVTQLDSFSITAAPLNCATQGNLASETRPPTQLRSPRPLSDTYLSNQPLNQQSVSPHLKHSAVLTTNTTLK